MAKKTALQGGALMVAFDGTIHPLATSCSLTQEYSTKDPETKDDGIMPEPDPDTKKFSITAEQQETNAFESFVALLAVIKAQAKKTVKVGKPSNYDKYGIGSKTAWTFGEEYLSGQAYLTSLGINAPMGQKATVSTTWSGTGTLNYVY